MLLDRTDAVETYAVVTHHVEVDHVAETLEHLRLLKQLGVAHEKLVEIFGYSGLGRYARQHARARREAADRDVPQNHSRRSQHENLHVCTRCSIRRDGRRSGTKRELQRGIQCMRTKMLRSEGFTGCGARRLCCSMPAIDDAMSVNGLLC
jgi:hypothetical protein